LQSQEGLARVDQITPCRDGSATVLAVAFDSKNAFTYPDGKLGSGVENAAIAAAHLMLAAKDVGVDSFWINFFDPEAAAGELELPENEKILMLLDLGYAAEGGGPLPITAPVRNCLRLFGICNLGGILP